MNSEDSDKSAHMYRLTRAFVDCIHKVDTNQITDLDKQIISA